jgi:hypothetical protein
VEERGEVGRAVAPKDCGGGWSARRRRIGFRPTIIFLSGGVGISGVYFELLISGRLPGWGSSMVYLQTESALDQTKNYLWPIFVENQSF